MNSYGFCFAACPCITQQTGAAFCTKGSGTSCTNWLRRNDKLSDVAHWKSWAFSTIALPTLQKEWRWGYPLGLFPNPRESFTVTPVNASRLQQLKVAITGKRTPYEDLFIPANNQEYHFLAKGIYWNQHLTFLSFTGNSRVQFYPIPPIQERSGTLPAYLSCKNWFHDPRDIWIASLTADLACHHYRQKHVWDKLLNTPSV